MHIEEVAIDGFKSYASKQEVGPFDKQFNAITGLNGSGKSNILDSICFVLGISNLSHVRVSSLNELVYKQGQAGVTKASVSIVFNNEDKSGSPVGFEQHDKITITRQIVIGGRNRYLLNGHNVQQSQIQNLFHSVQLNVNNPHFLIMQGRITKVINMKPPEILSMVEEASGTRMYETKKAQSVKVLEKKQGKMDEINRVLDEEVAPTLDKLKKERDAYLRWAQNATDIERLKRFCVAYEYTQYHQHLSSKASVLEEMKATIVENTNRKQELASREKAIEAELRAKAKERERGKSTGLQKKEDRHAALTKDLDKCNARLSNLGKEVGSEQENVDAVQAQITELQQGLENDRKAHEEAQGKFNDLDNMLQEMEAQMQRNQTSLQALRAGCTDTVDENGQTQSLRAQLSEKQKSLLEMQSDEKRITLNLQDAREQLAAASKVAEKSSETYTKLKKQHDAAEKALKQVEEAFKKLKFDPAGHSRMQAELRKEETHLHSLWEQIEGQRAQLSRLNFRYTDPCKNFDRSRVKGTVAQLIKVPGKYRDWTTALETAAGGRLYHVVVDTEETGKLLLKHGQLGRRVTFIPLNKIIDNSIAPKRVTAAKQIAGDGEVRTALEVVEYSKEVEAAMRYVFGHTLLCDSAATAKRVTFHRDVEARSVTKEGDLYDPTGTLTGGSNSSSGDTLTKLARLSDLQDQEHGKKQQVEQLRASLKSMASSAQEFENLERNKALKEHELQLSEQTMRQTSQGAAVADVEKLKSSIKDLTDELETTKNSRKKTSAVLADLEDQINNFDSHRDERASKLEKAIDAAQKKIKKESDKVKGHKEGAVTIQIRIEANDRELVSLRDRMSQAIARKEETVGRECKEKQHADVIQKELNSLDEELSQIRTELQQADEALVAKQKEFCDVQAEKTETEIQIKRLQHQSTQHEKDHADAAAGVGVLEKKFPWIQKEKQFFGKAGSDFDFSQQDYAENKQKFEEIEAEQHTLSLNINKKVMTMFEKAGNDFEDLNKKRDVIQNDKLQIEHTISELDAMKQDAVRRTWVHVNRHFGSIFSTLLPGASAKLEPPQGLTELDGLEIKVSFNGVWKQTLMELSGGQKSLLALSLVLALLLFKPAPMYILDEIDAALDLSHTQNIGHMIKTHFPHSQFIVVSLKEGMFNNANVLFRTRFVDGTSMVARSTLQNGVQQENTQASAPPAKGKKRKARVEDRENSGNVKVE